MGRGEANPERASSQKQPQNVVFGADGAVFLMSKGSENNRSEFRKQAHEFIGVNAVNFPLARSNKKALPCGEFFYWAEGKRTLRGHQAKNNLKMLFLVPMAQFS